MLVESPPNSEEKKVLICFEGQLNEVLMASGQ